MAILSPLLSAARTSWLSVPRSSVRHFLLCLGLGLLPALARAAPVDFDLPAQPASDALLSFSRQAHVEVIFSFDDLARVTSSAVIGRFEPEDALARLLRNTSFTARRNGRGKFTVTPAPRATGALTGRLLAPDGSFAHGVTVNLPEIHASVTTDEHGEFNFRNLPPGPYRVVAGGPGYRTLEIASIRVEGNERLTLETQTLQKAEETTRLEPFVVHDKSGRDEAFDRSRTPLMPQTATGNLDLSRTENDAIPFEIFDRKQISRSGVVNLNEFLQREILEGNASALSPDQNGQAAAYSAGSNNLDLRGFGSDETVILVNGRRLPETLTGGSDSAIPPDVSLIPVSLVEQIEVLPVSASSLYTGNPVGGVINIVLRPDVDVTELTTTYTNAVSSYDASQISTSLLHGETLLNNALKLRVGAIYTSSMPPTEAELGYLRAADNINLPLTDPIYRATPNIRSGENKPLLDGSPSLVTSVAPYANGNGDLAAFGGRAGLRNFGLFNTPGLATSYQGLNYPYGRRQHRTTYFTSVNYDFSSHLEVGVDLTYAHTVVNPGYQLYHGDLTLNANSALNPFKQEVAISLVDYAPALGENYNEALLDFYSIVGGALLKLRSDWRVSVDGQYARNIVKYRGLDGVDPARWQSLVDRGIYNPLRDTEAFGPPAEFYNEALIYSGRRGAFTTVGDYDTLDAAFRISNRSIYLPTGSGAINLGADYRRTHLANYNQRSTFSDGTDAVAPTFWNGRTLERISVFGEMQGQLLPTTRLPSWLRSLEGDAAVRYITSSVKREVNVAPTIGLKTEFAGGLTFRGSFTTSNRIPTPQMSSAVAQPGGVPGANLTPIFDPVRNERYSVSAGDAPNPTLQTENAITQTAGLVFQQGKLHRFRAALDFVDTHKKNEVQVVKAQDVIDLEEQFPSRVIRPGGANSRITQVITGAVNVASRHSQNWNLSLDYAESNFAGGTLDLYTRLLYFPKYDLQLFPNSPEIDEINSPDSNTKNILKYRANFGASWADRVLSYGVDGHYYSSRVLPAKEQVAQGGSHIGDHLEFDAYVQRDLTQWIPWSNPRFGLRGQLRVNNVFDEAFPRYRLDPTGVQLYGDWRGRTYSVSVTATF